MTEGNYGESLSQRRKDAEDFWGMFFNRIMLFRLKPTDSTDVELSRF